MAKQYRPRRHRRHTGAENLRVSYTYDKANRLLKSVGTPTGGAAETTAYTYDNNGNRLTAAKKTQELDPDPPVEQHSLSLTGLENGDLWQYTYDGFGRQTAVRGGGHTNAYTYDPGGLRTGKTVDGKSTSYVWDGQQIVLEQSTATTKYVRGLNLIANVGAATSHYLYNAHGDVVQLANTTGTVTKTYKYDAFGVEEAPASGDTNPFRYCGEQYDPVTGTVYLRARYYDVGNGRFTTEDSVRARKMSLFTQDGTYQDVELSGGLYVDWPEKEYIMDDPLSLNLYTYCQNNPTNYIDPSGNIAITLGTVAICAVGSLIYTVSYAWLQTPDGQAFVKGCSSVILGSVSYVGDGLAGLIAGMGEGVEAPAAAVDSESEHVKGKRPSTKNTHEKGQSRKKQDKGGEKGDARRNPNPNKRREYIK